MTPSMRRKLEELAERHQELEHLLASPDVLDDATRLRDLAQEHARLAPLVDMLARHDRNLAALEAARGMLDDAEMKALAAEEIAALDADQQVLDSELSAYLVPRDPRDEANLFLEVRAGTGGDEAAIFAGDLLRMYTRYAEQQNWGVEILSAHEGEHGGYREVVARIEGKGAYSRLKFESGTHRVQRVPETESQGRIHTSAATVAILPEIEAVDEVPIQDSDLRVDTFRASGAGGQHVNKTDSAIRITHLPSGIVVECQEERSQHKNRARALGLLRARLLDAERDRQAAEQAQTRRLQVGSGDRSQRIRTYNFPQGRITDHRINLTLHQLPAILDGELDALVSELLREDQIDQVQAMAEDERG